MPVNNPNAPTVTQGVPTVDDSGNVTIVQTLVYTAQQFLIYQANIQRKAAQLQTQLGSQQNDLANINTQLAVIMPVAAQVNTALLSTQTSTAAPATISNTGS